MYIYVYEDTKTIEEIMVSLFAGIVGTLAFGIMTLVYVINYDLFGTIGAFTNTMISFCLMVYSLYLRFVYSNDDEEYFEKN